MTILLLFCLSRMNKFEFYRENICSFLFAFKETGSFIEFPQKFVQLCNTSATLYCIKLTSN